MTRKRNTRTAQLDCIVPHESQAALLRCSAPSTYDGGLFELGGGGRFDTEPQRKYVFVPAVPPPTVTTTIRRERARMGKDSEHNRGRRKGTTLLRALVATFKWRLALSGVLMIGDAICHIIQVWGSRGGMGDLATVRSEILWRSSTDVGA